MNVTCCPACGEILIPGIRPWHKECQNCGYESSSLESHIATEHTISNNLDEPTRERALSHLRCRNFEYLRSKIEKQLSARKGDSRPRLLDVGCAHGWFLEKSSSSFDVLGIEPDKVIADEAIARNVPVRRGFFPDALSVEEKFDVIVFNDVLEHIPDILSILTACRNHLTRDGLLVINAPNRHGLFYRSAKLLARLGCPSFFNRMWQKGFPSPHVHYLDGQVVTRLATLTKFKVVDQHRLPSIALHGLYPRIRYAKGVSVIGSFIIATVLIPLIPLLRFCPSDIQVWYLRDIGGADSCG